MLLGKQVEVNTHRSPRSLQKGNHQHSDVQNATKMALNVITRLHIKTSSDVTMGVSGVKEHLRGRVEQLASDVPLVVLKTVSHLLAKQGQIVGHESFSLNKFMTRLTFTHS